MRPLHRLNSVLRQEAHQRDASDVNFAAMDSAEGAGFADRKSLTPASPPTQKRAHPLNAPRGTRARRGWLVTDEPREAPREKARESRDSVIAERMVNLVRELNQAMDEALRQGLVVEPALSRVKGRYGPANEADAYVLSLKLFRKLC